MKLLFLLGRFGVSVEAGLKPKTPTTSPRETPASAPTDTPPPRKKYPVGFTRKDPAPVAAEEG